jgi:hypothetical protein
MVTIIKQSGSPIDESEAEKFLNEWRDGFDRLFEAGGDMPTVTKQAKEFEEKLLKKYKLEKQIDLPKSMKAWKKLIDNHQSGIMVDLHAKTGELMFVILDQGF